MMNTKTYHVKVINTIRKADFVEHKRISLSLELKCSSGLQQNSKQLKTSDFSGTLYVFLTKREVKMAGYWPNFFFFGVFMDLIEVEVHNMLKKNEVNKRIYYTSVYLSTFLTTNQRQSKAS